MNGQMRNRIESIEHALQRISIIFILGNTKKDMDLLMEKVVKVSQEIWLCQYKMDAVVSKEISNRLVKCIKKIQIITEFYNAHLEQKKIELEISRLQSEQRLASTS